MTNQEFEELKRTLIAKIKSEKPELCFGKEGVSFEWNLPELWDLNDEGISILATDLNDAPFPRFKEGYHSPYMAGGKYPYTKVLIGAISRARRQALEALKEELEEIKEELQKRELEEGEKT